MPMNAVPASKPLASVAVVRNFMFDLRLVMELCWLEYGRPFEGARRSAMWKNPSYFQEGAFADLYQARRDIMSPRDNPGYLSEFGAHRDGGVCRRQENQEKRVKGAFTRSYAVMDAAPRAPTCISRLQYERSSRSEVHRDRPDQTIVMCRGRISGLPLEIDRKPPNWTRERSANVAPANPWEDYICTTQCGFCCSRP